MKNLEIERAKWPEFVEGFSHRHDGWLVSIAEESNGAKKSIARDVPLRGVVAAGSPSSKEVLVLAGGVAPGTKRVIASPVSMVVGRTDDGAEASLTITDKSAVRTVIEFRSPMLPELVDGMVPRHS